MYGIWVNAAAVVLGGLLGLLLRGGIVKRFEQTLGHALALCVILIGVQGAIKTDDMMLVIVCVVLGTLLGEALRIETALERLGALAQRKLSKGDNRFAEGFISATLLYCVGAMAVVGSLDAGLRGNGDVLMAKSALDGVSSIIFASTLGPGVLLSAVSLLIYQGGIALLSGSVQQFLPAEVISEMAAVGGVLILALGLNMLGVMGKRIKVGNMLPAILLPALYIPLLNWVLNR